MVGAIIKEEKKMFEFDFEGTCITDPFLDETGRFPVEPIEYYKLSFDVLTEIYEKYCKKESIPCVDALEYLFDGSSLTSDQNKWIKEFSKIWDQVNEREVK